MEKNDRKLVTGIQELKRNEVVDMCMFSFYSLTNYFKSVLKFGFKNSVTKDNLKCIKEMFRICKRERLIANFILKNVESFNMDAAMEVFNSLKSLNEKTMSYYFSIANGIDYACEANVASFGTRNQKDFLTLYEGNEIVTEVISLLNDKEQLRNFLGYPDDFWSFVDHHDGNYVIEVPFEDAKNITYVSPLQDGNGNFADFKMCMPKVIDLGTAVLAITLYNKAFQIYNLIGKPYSKDALGVDEEKVDDYIENQYTLGIKKFVYTK